MSLLTRVLQHPASVSTVTSLAHSEREPHPVVTALLPHLAEDPSRLSVEVAAGDEMLGAAEELFRGRRGLALGEYFVTGRRIVDLWTCLLRRHFPGRESLEILDFGSGWGRATRYLVADLPGAEISVADAMPEAVAFQEAAFGVRALPIPANPAGAPGSGPAFDAIFAASVFTHLPETSFHGWLGWLLGRVAPGGFLAFTASSPEVLPGGDTEPEDASFAFGADSENRVLDPAGYGTAWMREPFVRNAVTRHGTELVTVAFPRRVCHFQDLYVVIRPPGDPASLRDLEPEPRVMLEHTELTADGGLRAGGWVAVGKGAADPRSVEAWSGANPLAKAAPGSERGDLAGALGDPGLRGWSWSMEIPVPAHRLTEALVLLVVSGEGARIPVLAGSADAWIRQPAELARAEAARRAEFYSRRYMEVAAALEETGWERRRLETRVEAMERSRFWRARTIWFQIKRALGLRALE